MTLLRRVLGDTLRGRRLRQRRTLREVSGSARVSLGYLSEVERGQKEASSELLAAICEALDVKLSDLSAEVSDTMRRSERAAEVRRVPGRVILPAPSRQPVPAGVGGGPAPAEDRSTRRSTPTVRRGVRGGVHRRGRAGRAGRDRGQPGDAGAPGEEGGLDGVDLAELETGDGLGELEVLLGLTDLPGRRTADGAVTPPAASPPPRQQHRRSRSGRPDRLLGAPRSAAVPALPIRRALRRPVAGLSGRSGHRTGRAPCGCRAGPAHPDPPRALAAARWRPGPGGSGPRRPAADPGHALAAPCFRGRRVASRQGAGPRRANRPGPARPPDPLDRADHGRVGGPATHRRHPVARRQRDGPHPRRPARRRRPRGRPAGHPPDHDERHRRRGRRRQGDALQPLPHQGRRLGRAGRGRGPRGRRRVRRAGPGRRAGARRPPGQRARRAAPGRRRGAGRAGRPARPPPARRRLAGRRGDRPVPAGRRGPGRRRPGAALARLAPGRPRPGRRRRSAAAAEALARGLPPDPAADRKVPA